MAITERFQCKCPADYEWTGDYQGQIVLSPTIELRYNEPERKVRETVAVDACLKDELEKLWSEGVITTGCCCGHHTRIPYIGVEDRFIAVMKDKGYIVSPNPMNSAREDSFYPKSVRILI